MKRNECIAAVVDELHKVGITPLVSASGRHPRIEWTSVTGESRKVFTSAVVSDHRAKKNIRATVRRILKQDGVLK